MWLGCRWQWWLLAQSKKMQAWPTTTRSRRHTKSTMATNQDEIWAPSLAALGRTMTSTATLTRTATLLHTTTRTTNTTARQIKGSAPHPQPTRPSPSNAQRGNASLILGWLAFRARQKKKRRKKQQKKDMGTARPAYLEVVPFDDSFPNRLGCLCRVSDRFSGRPVLARELAKRRP